ncbi:flavodoxin domain-containing protein [Mesobacillus zeae]|uniref:Flavodoxin n=1 Tax=Mesobacillus zeae TaxID=1917180 RepID=A0A398BCD7_9BACI|nr:flavodoxin domain-containing protein [Mesobacillus zeae]RID87477.1 flavodoxin [Mesobacillus zeae]
MKAAIILASITGNTREAAEIICGFLEEAGVEPAMYTAEEFSVEQLEDLDLAVVATYTWGDGEIPNEMVPVFRAFEEGDTKGLVTGVTGTGDSFYPHFCGAVDRFRDMLYVQSLLAATLKIELSPQQKDRERCRKFVQSLLEKSEVNQAQPVKEKLPGAGCDMGFQH